MENQPLEESVSVANHASEPVNQQSAKKSKWLSKKVAYIVGVVVVIAVALFFLKSYFVVAMVNGHFVSRSSFIKEMEQQAGQQALDNLIITKLIENKVKDIQVSKEEVDAEIKKTEASLKTQGTTLADALTGRGINETEYRKRVTIQLKLEKLTADKTTVSDDEINKYLAANRAQLPKGLDQKTLRAQVADTIKQTKFNQEVNNLIDSLKADAKITYFIKL